MFEEGKEEIRSLGSSEDLTVRKGQILGNRNDRLIGSSEGSNAVFQI
jgi:hypothetical protein